MKKIIIFLALPIYISAQVDYYGQLQPIWDNNCTSCHSGGNPSGNLDLGAGSWNNLVNVSSTGYSNMRVVPYEPNNSVLYHKLFATGQSGDMMPPGGQLPLSERLLVQTWINEGANETGSGGSNGRIRGEISCDEEWGFNQIRLKLFMPGGGMLEQNWGEDPPFNDIDFEFDDPQITEGGPYQIVAYFDGNNNNMYDSEEPYDSENNLYVDGSLDLDGIELFLESDAGGGAGPTYIEITTPNSNTNWSVGTGENIEWNSSTSDGSDYTVRIELLKDGTDYLLIDPTYISGSNGGGYFWSIPSSLPADDDYEILIEHSDSGVEDISEMFSITSGGGGSNGKIAGEISVERSISGTIYVDLYYPGSVMNDDPPDISIPSDHVNMSPGNSWYYEFNNLPDGNGYTVLCLIDADSSPNSGTGNCDNGWDLGSMRDNINITGGSHENGDITLGECDGEFDHPVISNFSVTSGPVYVNGSDVDIYIQLDAMSGIDEADYTIRNGKGNTHSDDLSSPPGTDDWVGTIPSSEVSMEGLIVQFYAKSNSGDETTSDWYDIPVYFDQYDFVSLPHKEYMMVSFPGELDDDNAESVIANTLGGPDPTRWRSFGYNSSTEQYEENAGYFAPGRALWVIANTDLTADILSSGSGMVTSFRNSYSITLDQGWSMVGNPYAFPMDITDHVSSSGDVELAFYEYDGTGYQTVNSLQDGHGYWVWSNEAGAELIFDVIPTLASQRLMAGGWEMNLTASVNGFHDSVNKLGVHPQALDERDMLDAHEPPVIGDYIQMAFQNYNWQDAGLYSKDIRSEGSSHYVWDLTVRSNIAGQVNIIALDVSSIPLEFGAVLVDLENKVQHDIRSLETYSYVSIGDEEPHSFRVVVGLPDDVSKTMDELGILPTEFSVSQNTPNPFNPVTSIRIELIDDALVTMKVYNILGEEVSTLLNNAPLESGYHQVIFNGKDMNNNNVPSGLYLYQTIIRNNDGSLLHMNTHKMIMVK